MLSELDAERPVVATKSQVVASSLLHLGHCSTMTFVPRPRIMRTLLGGAPCALLATSAAAQFGPPQIVIGPGPLIQDTVAADVDGDGDLDVLSASYEDDTIAWQANDGSGNFGPRRAITSQADGALVVHAADLDGDGDPDVLAASELDDEISVHMNLGGGTFAPAVIVTNQAQDPRDLDTADLDGDGDLDVLSASESDHVIAWYENVGGVIGARRVLATQATGALSVHAADIDGDGDIDVVGGYAGALTWYENLGGAIFGPQHPVASGGRYSGLQAVDFDSDGDLDLLSALISGGDPALWHENLGAGAFVSGSSLTGSYFWIDCHGTAEAADVDGDGDADVIWSGLEGGACGGSGCDRSLLAWTENLGNGAFGNPHAIANSGLGSSSVCAADLDSDGDADVLSAGGYLAFQWFENQPGSVFGPEQVIPSTAASAHDVDTADIDGDGDTDVVSATDTGIWWHEQLAGGGFLSHPITTGNTPGLCTGDLDGDGDTDVLSLTQSIEWIPNTGAGVFATARVPIDPNRGQFAQVVDLDGDGDLDILAAVSGGALWTIGWFRNLGGGAYGPLQGLGSVRVPAAVRAADLDGDGDQEVLWSNWLPPTTFGPVGVFVAENLGGVFGPPSRVSAWANTGDIRTGDLDGDGDLDVAVSQGGALLWYENLGGLVFGSARTASAEPFPLGGAIEAGDVDGDGRVDLVADNTIRVTWHRNLTGGSFSPGRIVAHNSAAGFHVDDLDSDGDPDVLLAAGDTVVWHANVYLAGSYCAPSVLNSTGLPGLLFAAGSSLVTDNDVTLIAEHLPQQTFGFVLTSSTQGFTAGPGGSQGNLCLDGAIGRYVGPGQVQSSGTGGRFEFTIDLTDLPQPLGSVSVQSGETWNFQAWYRDANPMLTSNFTSAVSVAFQ